MARPGDLSRWILEVDGAGRAYLTNLDTNDTVAFDDFPVYMDFLMGFIYD